MTESSRSIVVVDATFGIRLAIASPQQARYDAFLSRWRRDGLTLIAPTLWRYEVTSGITKTLRLGGLPRASGEEALALLEAQDIELVPPDARQTKRAFEWTIALGRVAAYDSFYLALAEQRDATLWTGDKRLFNAVGKPWVRWLDDPQEVLTDSG